MAGARWTDRLRPPWRVARRLFAAAVLTPKDAIVSSWLARNAAAPRCNVVQFWDNSPPEEIVRAMSTWQHGRCSRWFDYLRFDDKSAREFIRENCGKSALWAYDACAVPAMKADFFRYCFLHVHGGLWADADLRCIGNLYPLLCRSGRGVIASVTDAQTGRVRLQNAVMMVRYKQDSLMVAIIERCMHNIKHRIANNVNVVTGPGAMTALMRTQPALFSGYRIVPFRRLTLRYVWGLADPAYKRTSTHWTRWQRERSIFADDE